MTEFEEQAMKEKELLIEIRRHLHENPELSGEERNTIRYIEEKLSEFGIRYVEVEQGGILGFIDGKKEGKTLLLRADCDALPIQEDPCNFAGPKTCVSQVEGVMHACGHDAHTAVLLLAAKLLQKRASSLEGNLVLCFERGEEGNRNNLYYLMKYLENHRIRIDGAWGMHVFSEGFDGAVHIASGPVMAGNFSFDYTLLGNGGHGARPDCARNPIDCFQAIAGGISSIRMNTVSPFLSATLTVCYVESGGSNNVIPEILRFGGNGRYYDREQASIPMYEKLVRLVKSCAEVYGCEIAESRLTPPGYSLDNNKDCYRITKRAMASCLAPDRIRRLDPMMGSETFAFLSRMYPAAFAYYGVANREKGITSSVHNAKFDIDEDTLPGAVACTVAYSIAFLSSQGPIEFQSFPGGVDELFRGVGRLPK